MKHFIILSICLMGFTGCNKAKELNSLVDYSTYSIQANTETVQRSTAVIQQNAALIQQTNSVIEENRRLLESMH